MVARAWTEAHPARIPVAPLAGRAELAGFTDVTLRTTDDLALSGWWKAPRNGAAVLLVHGFGANREQMLPQALALARAGFGVLLLDLRAHGQSEGTLCTWGDDERLDVAAGVDFLAARPTVDRARIGTLGFSIGGLAVADEAEGDPRVAAVVLEAMHPTLESEFRHAHSNHGAWSELAALWALRAVGLDFDSVRPIDGVCALAPRPLLLVYGGADPVAPPAIGELLAGLACGPATLWVVPGGGHGGWDGAAPAELSARLTSFFEGALLR